MHQFSRSRRILTRVVTYAATGSVAAVSLVPGLAAARTGGLPRALDERIFNADIKGVQTTSWTLNLPGGGPCDPAQTGHGKERIVFRTRRPARLDVKRYGTSYVVVGDPFTVGANDIAVQYSVTRSGSIETGPIADGCPDNGGPDLTSTPDCGTKRGTIGLALDFANEPRHGFTLTDGEIGVPVDPFHDCPWTGGVTTFPHLLDSQNHRPILAALPVSDLFDRGLGQQIAVARGTERINSAGTTAVSRIRWDVRLTRAGH
jgi:hypothetical protein